MTTRPAFPHGLTVRALARGQTGRAFVNIIESPQVDQSLERRESVVQRAEDVRSRDVLTKGGGVRARTALPIVGDETLRQPLLEASRGPPKIHVELSGRRRDLLAPLRRSQVVEPLERG